MLSRYGFKFEEKGNNEWDGYYAQNLSLFGTTSIEAPLYTTPTGEVHMHTGVVEWTPWVSIWAQNSGPLTDNATDAAFRADISYASAYDSRFYGQSLRWDYQALKRTPSTTIPPSIWNRLSMEGKGKSMD